MTKVWVVSAYVDSYADYAGTDIMGVFSTEEKARDYIVKYREHSNSYAYDGYSAVEQILDEEGFAE